jgi:hypothetical protein
LYQYREEGQISVVIAGRVHLKTLKVGHDDNAIDIWRHSKII